MSGTTRGAGPPSGRGSAASRLAGLAIACAATLTTLAPTARADLIVNGSFEQPAVPAGWYTNFPGRSNAIAGWTVVGVDSSVVSTMFTQDGIRFQAQHGEQWLDLAGVDSNSSTSGVSQDVPTETGRTYLLRFHVGSATDGVSFFPSTVDLSIDGGARVGFANLTAPADRLSWKEFTVSFTATSSTTNITFYNGGAPNNYLNALDNVTLAVVPKPPSVQLAAIGIVGISGVRTWNRRCASRHAEESVQDGRMPSRAHRAGPRPRRACR